jgi:hypothetical protein
MSRSLMRALPDSSKNIDATLAEVYDSQIGSLRAATLEGVSKPSQRRGQAQFAPKTSQS